MKPARKVLLRDGLIFMVKLWLDSVKDVVLSAAAFFALIFDFARADQAKPYRFYKVMQFGERVDLWLNLYSASRQGADHEEGLFGASRAGEDTLLGQIEQLTGGERGRRTPGGREP